MSALGRLMLWFRPLKVEIHIKDAHIARKVREESFMFFVDLTLRDGQDALRRLVFEKKVECNMDFVEAVLKVVRIRPALYRGIKKRDYHTFLRHGTTRTEESL